MTVSGWILFSFLCLVIVACGMIPIILANNIVWKIISGILIAIFIVLLLYWMLWYYENTAAGQRELIDQKSNFSNGLDRIVTIYTANGDIIAQYKGKIDIEGNDGGYVLFDYNGKRYMYYNCFIESIADLGE